MKRALTGVLLGLVLSTLVIVPPVFAKVMSSEGPIVIGEDEIVDDDLFVGAESVRIAGTVNGDVYVGGSTVNISGTVNGDVLAGGGIVEISGQIKDDVWVGGGNIIIRGAQIGDSLTLGGGTVSIDDQTRVGGGLLFGAGQMVNDASVGRGVIGGGGLVELNGPIMKDVLLGADTLRIGPGASVGGDLKYQAESDVEIAPEAKISGKVTELEPKVAPIKEKMEEMKKAEQGFKYGFRLWSFLAALVVGSVWVWLSPKYLNRLADQLSAKALPSLGWGVLTVVLMLPVFIVLLITVIGIPLAFLWLLMVMVAGYLSKLVVGLCLGKWLGGRLSWKMDNLWMLMFIGLAGFYLLQMVPWIGWLAGLIGSLMGLGAFVGVKREKLGK